MRGCFYRKKNIKSGGTADDNYTASVLKSIDFWAGAFYIREVIIVSYTGEWRWLWPTKDRQAENTMKKKREENRI